MSITPFKIAVPNEQISLLKTQLASSTFPLRFPGAEDWSRGPPLANIKRLASFWEHQFNWRKVESEPNKLPQFTLDIAIEGFGSYNVHFIHEKSVVKNPIPLLFVHGWPGSFVEVTKLLPQLLQGGEDCPAFHVVAPSLIDFGFSDASRKARFNIDEHAEACRKLMMALGYTEYIVQGGDLESAVARIQAARYGPDHCKTHHINSAAPAEPTNEKHPDLYAKVQSTPSRRRIRNRYE